MVPLWTAGLFALRTFVPAQQDELPFEEHPPEQSREPVVVREIATYYASATLRTIFDVDGPAGALYGWTAGPHQASTQVEEDNGPTFKRVTVHAPVSRKARIVTVNDARVRGFPRGV